MLLASPAKVNLFLRVGPLRPDGFHGLVSWFCSVGLADQLEFIPSPGHQVTLACDNPQVPCDQRNLVMRAAALLEKTACRPSGVKIFLRKQIPMGGGLGGGSSNAAVALRGLAELWQSHLPEAELSHLAAQLGSDVPFFLQLPSAICRGRGEQITPIPPPTPRGIVLILPAISMPTPAVYRRFDEMRLGTDLQQVENNLPQQNLSTRQLLAVLVNDLEAPAFSISPVLGELRQSCEQLAGRPVRMSGSGSTLFTLYDTLAEAQNAAQELRQKLALVAQGYPLGY